MQDFRADSGDRPDLAIGLLPYPSAEPTSGGSEAMVTTRRTPLLLVAALTLLAGAADAAKVVRLADQSGSEKGRRAAELCRQVDVKSRGDGSVAQLEQSLAMAEKALAENEKDAKAHFAVFCSLGRRAEIEGADMESLTSLGRLRDALDRALEIEPSFVDALLAKGRMLARLPWILGGDAEEGERLIRHALELDPSSTVARLQLAHVLSERGEDAEARRIAREVVDRAEKPALRDEAHVLVASLSK
jgi:tetratricopeptide (TPR) repeat protein